MQIYENFSLKPFNTFGIDCRCRYFVEVTSLFSLQNLLNNPQWQALPKLILGEGSNILLSENFPGLVIKMAIKHIQILKEDATHSWLRIGAGENWHQLVLYAIDKQLSGIENLSLIPGTVGAAPIQNIGAYGVELYDVLESLQAIRIKDGQIKTFTKAECELHYRDSIFKNTLKNQYIILSVDLRLNKIPQYQLHYGAIKDTLNAMQVKDLSIKAISDAVIKIRQEKLPDPKKIGNAGSFFKSPMLTFDQFNALKQKYPKIPYFIHDETHYKIPAGWLIEQCGWKGKRLGDVGVHAHHALVLVNYGRGTGQELLQLAEKIQLSVLETFSIPLIPEVNIISSH